VKTQYKFIHFEEVKTDDKPYYWIRNNKSGDYLGCISWYPNWKMWVFSAADDQCVFNDSCLKDIIHFMGQLK